MNRLLDDLLTVLRTYRSAAVLLVAVLVLVWAVSFLFAEGAGHDLVAFLRTVQWTDIIVFYVTPLAVLLVISVIGRAVSRSETSRLDRMLAAAEEREKPAEGEGGRAITEH